MKQKINIIVWMLYSTMVFFSDIIKTWKNAKLGDHLLASTAIWIWVLAKLMVSLQPSSAVLLQLHITQSPLGCIKWCQMTIPRQKKFNPTQKKKGWTFFDHPCSKLQMYVATNVILKIWDLLLPIESINAYICSCKHINISFSTL